MEQVTEVRCTKDEDKSKALLVEVFKRLGNSGYGNVIETLERKTNIINTKDEKFVDRALRSTYISALDERVRWKAKRHISRPIDRSSSILPS